MDKQEHDLLIRIDERVKDLAEKIDVLVEKQPEQDKQININKEDIRAHGIKHNTEMKIFGLAWLVIVIGAIIAKAIGG